MVRKILFHVIPFLLPFIAYGLYAFATHRARAKGAAFDEAPWYWLFSIGLALTALSLVGVWAFSGVPVGGEYVAPQLEDGKIIPGTFK